MPKMKKKFLLTILLILFFNYGFSQTSNFEEDYDRLIQYLMQENWNESEKLSMNLLKSIESDKDMEMETMVLRYIYLYSNAGLLNENEISKDEALKKALFLKGKELIMPGHPFRENCYSNCTRFSEDEKDTFFTGVTNANATQIFSFEYVHIPDGIKESESELTAKFITLKGTLNEISIEGEILPRYRLIFINGDYQIEDF